MNDDEGTHDYPQGMGGEEMNMKYKSSVPFPNGSTYMFFSDTFCCRCTKYRLDEEGMPLPDNCGIENTISRAQLDTTLWPGENIVATETFSYVCLSFESEDADVMEQYRALFESIE